VSEADSAFPDWREHKVGEHVRMHYVGGEHVIFIREVMQPGGAGPRHRHDRAEELMYVAAGAFTVTIGDVARNLRAGEVAIVPRGTEHELQTDEGGTYYLFFSPGNGQLPVDDFHLVGPAAE
jgi:quercetin dioxygenase-like cupin family protein